MNAQIRPDLNQLILSHDEVRAIDAAAIESLRIPGLLLMENAARGIADQLGGVAQSGQITIVCGPGNNGGDGLALARQLAARGCESRVLLETAGKSLSIDAQSNLQFLTNSGVPVRMIDENVHCRDWLSEMSADDWLVDSLLGTGIQGDLREPFRSWVQAINASPAHVLAVDVPTGLNCDDGSCGNDCVRAELTVTFVGMKRGFLVPAATPYTGRVVVAHIGIPEAWVRDWVQGQRAAGA